MKEQIEGFARLTEENGTWKTPSGEVVPWYEVRTDLRADADVEEAMERVLSVYGVSDVVVDAFRQFRRELFGSASKAAPAE
jgi:hypothetical protein